MLLHQSDIDPEGGKIGEDSTLSYGKNLKVKSNLLVYGDVTIGDDVEIESNVTIYDSTILSNVVVEVGAKINRSSIGKNVRILRHVSVTNCIVLDGCVVGTNITNRELRRDTCGRDTDIMSCLTNDYHKIKRAMCGKLLFWKWVNKTSKGFESLGIGGAYAIEYKVGEVVETKSNPDENVLCSSGLHVAPVGVTLEEMGLDLNNYSKKPALLLVEVDASDIICYTPIKVRVSKLRVIKELPWS